MTVTPASSAVLPAAILDRALTPRWLDVALRLAREGRSVGDTLAALDIALGDDIPQETARHKTRTALSHVWLTPPAAARPLVAWGIAHAEDFDDLRPLHLGALLATYPFFGDACAFIGRQLALQQEVNTTDVRKRLRARWGDRSTVDVAGRRVVWTLRAFGVLTGAPGDSMSRLSEPLRPAPTLRPWLVDALLLTRGAQEVDGRELASAPEFFMFRFPPPFGTGYPHVEQFNEGGGRIVFRRKGHDAGVVRPTQPRLLALA